MIIAVDFDGTLVEHRYPEIGKEISFAFSALRSLQAAGHMLILWTSREGELLDQAVEYCRQRGVEFYAVNTNNPDSPASLPRKVVADIYIDDRNLGGLPEWGVITQQILDPGYKPSGPQRTLWQRLLSKL